MATIESNISILSSNDKIDHNQVDGFRLFTGVYLLSVCVCGVILNAKAILTLISTIMVRKVFFAMA